MLRPVDREQALYLTLSVGYVSGEAAEVDSCSAVSDNVVSATLCNGLLVW